VMRAIGRRLLSRLGAVWVLSHIIMVLLGTLFLGTWSRTWIGVGLAEGIGGSLIASGVAGVSLFLYVSFTDTLRAQIETISKAGLSTIYSGRSVQIRDAYQHRLTVARKIDLIGYGLSSFRQDYLEHFVDWSRRAQVRILLIDPDFPTPETSLADQRDREEQHSPGKTRGDVLAFEDVVSKLSGLRHGQYKVHRVSCIPAINVFRIDDEIFWGPYLMHQQSRNTPTLLVARGGFLFDSLEKHFEALWSLSTPSPLR
jgi:hypothetical protein